MIESDVETYFKKQVEAHGGMCLKFVSVNRRGVPDRIVIHPSIGPTFVELKAPNEKPRKQQKHVHKLMREAGAEVYVIDSKEGVDAFVERLRG